MVKRGDVPPGFRPVKPQVLLITMGCHVQEQTYPKRIAPTGEHQPGTQHGNLHAPVQPQHKERATFTTPDEQGI